MCGLQLRQGSLWICISNARVGEGVLESDHTLSHRSEEKLAGRPCLLLSLAAWTGNVVRQSGGRILAHTSQAQILALNPFCPSSLVST